ncbi:MULTISPECIES: ATP/GTP-binding protein [unclassified Streptomyces]|uniref:ATP/GTP-binding protein n=1 Tax=unclassified Streptomyces TaxID=2593676 RepID=UPI002DDA4846|nr:MULTISPECIES: ATP/GTP-binding protein [unclassified Streptomyces]WSA92303.1 ATP/GTP-binding protein [Streptomyces sp. NBC_01795]WSB76672.1 ATP/GTP-binding protein [Streptomyces sp. NBC_01775]WSS15041.1 ATP/GTP-binding protein [Streptomyces sp. NBC_01186]WSS43884.1 ATP/GTP-binding protein [Streptomyces sp. NBC_01187]
MSPRRNRSRGGAAHSAKAARFASATRRGEEEGDAGERYGLERTENWRGEEWSVRQISGGAATKHYRCPGCDQEIPPGVPHVVAWPSQGDVDDRRHWHRACWNARDRRSVRLQRSRNAPRY